MVVFIWVIIILAIIGGVLGIIGSIEFGETNLARIGGSCVCIILASAIAVGCFWWLYSTQSGARARKTFVSEVSGGLNRVVHVYDMEGDLIAEYNGKFDVDESATDGITKIKFDMDGKRHIIYSSTGTVIIDEVDK